VTLPRIACLLLFAAAAAAQEPLASSCATHCHGEEATAYRHDVHRNVLRCVDCHGGNPGATRDKEQAHDPAHGYRGRPERAAIPALCGDCHADPQRMALYSLATDELALYRVSAHGIAVLQKGRTDAAVCSDCHGAHGILPSHDRRAPTAAINQPATCAHCHADQKKMDAAGLPHDTVARFLDSVHGHVLIDEDSRGAPACADCHGAHGARPPGARDLVQVCERCHAATGEIYRDSAHGRSAEMNCRTCHADETGRQFHRSDCTACHGTHSIDRASDAMFQGDEPGHCDHCHQEAGAAQEFVRTVLDGKRHLRERLTETRADCARLRERGLFLEHEASFLRESQRALVSARPKVHGLDTEGMRRHFEDGARRQEQAREMIGKKERVLRDRGLILGGIAAFLLMFAAVLGVRLRELRRPR
jgi:hypothetical protein